MASWDFASLQKEIGATDKSSLVRKFIVGSAGRRGIDIHGQLRQAESQNYSTAHGDYSTRSTFRTNQRLQSFPGSLRGFSFANFVRNKLSEQILKLAWQRRAEGRQIVRVQLATDCG